jgi:CHAT domain-containing protein
LVVICNPRSDQNTIIESLPAIDVQKEKATLQSIFDPLVTQNIVEYDILEPGTWRNLKRALLEEKYHVVHFIAHGAYINNEFCLIMDGENPNEWFITKDKFVDQDLHSNPLQLFVLISCEGGSFNENLNTKALGPILVERGIPYVIAMQKPISFYAAERFSKLFYENLIDYGSIDKAMAITRSDLKEDPQLKLLAQWAIPVLFMATNEAELLKT